MSSSTFAT